MELFEHILDISNGECEINDEMILQKDSEIEQQVLQGLSYLHADLDLGKIELRKALEAEFRVKTLEAKNKQLEQFNYVASHDLQEPLRTISNFSLLLKTEYGNNLNSTAHQYLEFIIQSSDRMRELILGLLNLSRLGKGSLLTKVNCNKLLEDLQIDLRASITDNNADITVDKLPNLWAYELELRQLFQNLISNALKFSQEGRDAVIKISCKQTQEDYTFCVQDNGIGISEKYHERIFILFQRLHSRGAYEGTGIGLANCRKIVEMHEGKMWVESKVGAGSSFFFTIANLK